MNKNAKSILDIITSSTEHPTAEQIYLKLKENSSKAVLATVYNNLTLLHGQGYIRKVCVEGCPDRYDNTKRHDHIVCRICGKLSDIALPDLTPQLQAQTKEEILSYDLKLSYICPQCKKSGDKDSREMADIC